MAELDDLVAAARDGDGTATTKPTAETSTGSRPGGPLCAVADRIEARQHASAPPLAVSRPGGPLCAAIDRIEVGQPPP